MSISETGGTSTARMASGARNGGRGSRRVRTILGGNGVTLDYSPLRHANNLEGVRTYEGTDEVHTLVLGHALTGIAAFR